MPQQTHFILNDRPVKTSASPGTLVLDYLRKCQHLVGTKEGCKEGDCGACVVLIGELAGSRVEYHPVTSCLVPLGELHGKHLVTIEGLNMATLSPVQQAIVDEGGSQCGFCTPGIVVSLTGYLMHAGKRVCEEGIKVALGGNLCRCTGYASLLRAGKRLVDQFGESTDGNGGNNAPQQADSLRELVHQNAVPDYFTTIPDRLRTIAKPRVTKSKTLPDYVLAGGTDIYVQKGEQIPDADVRVLNLHPEMKGIAIENGRVHVGALTTFEEFGQDPQINKMIPEIQHYNHHNASWQIRNRATLGGNIINASPIGDMTALLLALESELVLKDGQKQRTVAMKSFFKGYKALDKTRAEILTEIVFPLPEPASKIHFEKISKRQTLDIASVNSAIKICCQDGTIQQVHLTMGGVAPIPLFMHNTCDFLVGKPIAVETLQGAFPVAMAEISPISDIRGSAEYKRLLVRQVLIAHFTKLFPEHLTVRDFYETH
ncbi:MAG: FAD binding domain-containing protein [bacterium]